MGPYVGRLHGGGGAHGEREVLGVVHCDLTGLGVQAAAQTGSSEVPGIDDAINLHFVALVEKNGMLWELDGRRAGPICHGKTSHDTLLADCARVVKTDYVDKRDAITFSLMALGLKAL